MWKLACFLSFHALLLFIPSTVAYPGGPPISSCYHQQPIHRPANTSFYQDVFPTKVTPSPFVIQVSSSSWNVSQDLQVVLKRRTGQQPFKGFAIKAVRTRFNSEELLGSFHSCTTQPSGSSGVRYRSFYPTVAGDNNCITHTGVPVDNVTCLWKAPAQPEGPIRFKATVVVALTQYYTEILSNEVESFAGVGTNINRVTNMVLPTTLGCGSTKTCFLYPPLCAQRGSCSHGVMFDEVSKDHVAIEFFGTAVNWLGLNLNPKNVMDGGESFICLWDNVLKSVNLETGYAPAKFVTSVLRKDITNIRAYYSSDLCDSGCRSLPIQPNTLACRFIRPKNATFSLYMTNLATYTDSKMDISRSLNSPFFVHLAQGEQYSPGSGGLRQHRHLPLMSSVSIKMGDPKQTLYFAGLSKTVQIHGTLMTIFWLFLAGFNIVVARHTRPVFTYQLFWGKAIWFLMHVGLNVLGFLVGVAGFVYMLVKLNGQWEPAAGIHGGFGLAAMCMAGINIIMGLFRPEVGSTYRHYFNILHRWNGMLGFILAIIAVWLGATINDLRPEFQFWAVVVLGIWTAAQIFFMILFECFRQGAAREANADRIVEKQLRFKYQSDSDKVELEKSEEEIKGKKIVHLTSKSILFYVLVILGLTTAFWAGLWIH